jgi:hypothetical protein
MRLTRLIASALIGLLVSGCTSIPKYERRLQPPRAMGELDRKACEEYAAAEAAAWTAPSIGVTITRRDGDPSLRAAAGVVGTFGLALLAVPPLMIVHSWMLRRPIIVRDPASAGWSLAEPVSDYTLDTSGVPAVLRQAVDSLTRLGVCGLIGLAGPGAEVRLEMSQLLQGRILRGIIQGDRVPNLFIPQLIDLYQRGRFPFDRMVAYYPLEQINQAAADSVSGAVMKPVLRVG